MADQQPSPSQLRIEREREALLRSITSGDGDTVLHRVAIVLNRFPETRDSDLKLMLRFWEAYEGYDGGVISPADLFERARLMSLTRARARIQNTFNLFQATPDVRKRRGKLSDEERDKAREATERHPGTTVLFDESGKAGPDLIIGAVWFADPEEFYKLTRKLGEWRAQSGFSNELHFKDLDERSEPFYREAIDLVLAECASVSFKAASVPKEGVKRTDEALEELMYQLLRRGVQHEHDSGRAVFPRTLQVWKDLEAKGSDRLLLARLKDRLTQAAKIELDSQLTLDDFEAVESDTSDPMQIADLFAASLNRFHNVSPAGNVKDRFARFLLERVGALNAPLQEGAYDVDSVMHFRL